MHLLFALPRTILAHPAPSSAIAREEPSGNYVIEGSCAVEGLVQTHWGVRILYGA
jgi:hypothetical protein